MKRWFALISVQNKNHAGFPVGPSPSGGEELGFTLKQLADAEVERLKNAPSDYWKGRVIQIYLLAADAYEIGAGASIGHNRTDRYQAAARVCRMAATELGWEG